MVARVGIGVDGPLSVVLKQKNQAAPPARTTAHRLSLMDHTNSQRIIANLPAMADGRLTINERGRYDHDRRSVIFSRGACFA